MSIPTPANSSLNLRLCLLSALGICAPSLSQAALLPSIVNEQAAINADTAPTTELDEIVVTASRTPTKVTNTIAQTRVIDSEELQRYQGQSVLDVLSNQPGINITQSGGMGTTSNFYMRGFDSKQVLVLIDGVRYESISSGTPAINLLSADQIDRIEILYGATGASLYGSDAMGGVIQIFTKGSNATTNNASVTAGVGSHNLYNVGVNGQYTANGTALSLGASHTKTDGFNAIANPSSSNYYPDDDGFETNNASLALNHHLSDEVSMGLSALYSESTTEFDSYGKTVPNAYADQKNGSANTYIQYQTPLSVTKLSYGQSIDKSTSHDGNSIDYKQGSQFDTTQKQARLETNINAQPGTAILGAEWLSQNLEASDVNDWSTGAPVKTAYDPDNRIVKSAFVGYQLAERYYDLQANYRVDDNSQYDTQNTYNLGVAIRPMTGLRIGANYATGFRAPTFNDLYFPGYNNPNLKPEHSKSTEAFIEFANDTQRTRVTGYRTDAENLIASGSNIGKAKIKGASLTSDWTFESLLFGLGYDYLEATDDTSNSPNYGNDIRYRPNHSGTVYIGYQQPSYDVRVEAKHTGDRFNDETNKTKLDAYTLVNLSGNVYITPQLRANLRVNNITDEEYTLSNQYGDVYATDGTSYFGSLTYSFY